MSRIRQADFFGYCLVFAFFQLARDRPVTSSARVHLPDEMAQKSVGWNFSCWLLGFQVEAGSA